MSGKNGGNVVALAMKVYEHNKLKIGYAEPYARFK